MRTLSPIFRNVSARLPIIFINSSSFSFHLCFLSDNLESEKLICYPSQVIEHALLANTAVLLSNILHLTASRRTPLVFRCIAGRFADRATLESVESQKKRRTVRQLYVGSSLIVLLCLFDIAWDGTTRCVFIIAGSRGIGRPA